MLFSANTIMISLRSFSDSVVSLCIAVWEVWIWIPLPSGLPLLDSCAEIKPQVLQGRNLLCSPRMPRLLGEAVWARGLPGGGLCRKPPWQNGEYLRGLQEELSARKKGRALFQIQLFFPFFSFLNIMCLPIANYKRRHRVRPAYPLLSWWYFVLHEMLLSSVMLGRGYSASPEVPELED